MDENKLNFSEEEKKRESEVEQTKEEIKKETQGLFASFKFFLNEVLGFRGETDREETVQAIKKDIPFKGATAWVLVCSVFVASVGLNANSTAVVIGAMLISPLMGPILGVGFSIAINDIDTLKRSLVNLGIMVVLSLLTAFLFFWSFPLSEDTSELLGRVKPDIRDVLIAFFGGMALIIARTKRGTIESAIYGVAIATALMPPLCTAGYGLAIGNWQYFGGAMYLFTINTIFIALATFIVLKVLRFPMLKYVNSIKRKRIGQLASLLAIVVMVPAIWTFINVLQESNFNREFKDLPHFEYIKSNASFSYVDRNKSSIDINTFVLDEIPETTISLLKGRMREYSALAKSSLNFNQNFGTDKFRYMEELRSRDSLDLLSQTQKTTFLEGKVKQLSKLEKSYIPFEELSKEVKINYENLDRFSFANEINTNFTKTDTINVFTVKWNNSVTDEKSRARDNEKLEKWLKLRLKLDTLVVKRLN